MNRDVKIEKLIKTSAEMRLKLLQMFSFNKAHHFGGSFSCVEIVTALYFYKMQFRADNYLKPDRDRFIMSKGHTVPTQYVALALMGIIPDEELASIKRLGTRLQGHPDILKTPGIEAPTGSLGQGLSYANGFALGGRFDDLQFNIYLVLGDGELQEGQVWEAAMTAAHYGLSNVCVIIDRNRLQSQGKTDELMGIEPLAEKWKAFGWDTETVDGHDIRALADVLDTFPRKSGRPFAIIANTVKGKGISFMENTFKYHNFNLTEQEYLQAQKELQSRLKDLE
ncbi:MAG: transketolase [Spirochaetales bacterium]|nr:MAG: transketolase [Spirochaetales bacterium]